MVLPPAPFPFDYNSLAINSWLAPTPELIPASVPCTIAGELVARSIRSRPVGKTLVAVPDTIPVSLGPSSAISDWAAASKGVQNSPARAILMTAPTTVPPVTTKRLFHRRSAGAAMSPGAEMNFCQTGTMRMPVSRPVTAIRPQTARAGLPNASSKPAPNAPPTSPNNTASSTNLRRDKT